MASSTYSLLTPSSDPWVNGLTNGTYWSLGSNRTVTWSMADFAGDSWNASVAGPVIESVLSKYAEVANINFSYIGYSSAPGISTANMTFVETSLAAYMGYSGALAWAYFPNEPLADYMVTFSGATATQYPNSAGDVWLNASLPEIYLSPLDPGSTTYFVLLHEVGHALGLKHPHDNGLTSRPTFDQLGISLLDNQLLTVMSYDEATSVASWYSSYGLPSSIGYPSTLMPMDVIALQSIYGPNLSTRSGNSLYSLYNDSSVETYWDAGGIDTLSAADSSFGWYVNMNIALGNYRIALATPIVDWWGNSETGKFFFNTENIQGSSYQDTLVGDAVSNIIDGGSGDDLIAGGAGADSLSGGYGNDIIDGSEGDDIIAGGYGNDILALGGNDSATGGLGGDVFCITKNGNYTITDFNPYEDLIIFDSYSTPHKSLSMVLGDVTYFSNANGDINVTFGDGTTVRLVGCAYANINVDFFYNVIGAIENLMAP